MQDEGGNDEVKDESSSTEPEIKVIESLEELKLYRGEWDSLLRKNNNANPFVEFDWIEKWWSFLGEGHNMFVLLITGGGIVVGVCPLMITKKGLHKEINFIGYPEASYMDFILAEESRDKCIKRLVKYLLELRGNHILSLFGFFEDSPNFRIIKEYLSKNNYYFFITEFESPFIKINKKFEDYYKERYRHDSIKTLKRSEKKLVSAGELTYEKVDSSRIDEIFKLHDKRWKKKNDLSNFSGERASGFFRGLALEEGLSFRTSVTALMLNKKLIAFYYGFICNRKYFAYRVAHDDDFAIFAPGKIIVKEAIKDCFEGEIDIFDFGLGYARYKYDWADEKACIKEIVFPTHSAFSKIIYKRYSLRKKLIKTLKKSKRYVYVKVNIMGKIKYFISGGYFKECLSRLHFNIKSQGFKKASLDILKRSWSSIYSAKEYTIYEKVLDGNLSHQANYEAEGYEITEGNLKDLDELCEVTGEEATVVVNRFYKRQRCFTLRHNDSIVHCSWVDTNNIELPAINYKEPLKKGKACITNCTEAQSHKNLNLETKALTHILNTLSQEGLTKCIIPVERKNLSLKNSITKASFTPNGFIKYKRLLMQPKVINNYIKNKNAF
jgi:CelD/BcsL family acetyltransferase involved in cellulose biosynthesis